MTYTPPTFVADGRLPRSTGWSALVWAACNERTRTVGALLEAHADVVVRDSRGTSAMSCAIERGDIEAVRLLRAAGASANVSDRTLAETALRRAADTGNLERMRALLAQGVDPNAADQYGERPLLLAAQKGRTDVVRLLIEHGADVNAKRQDGTNALYLAESWRHREIVELLKQAGAREETPPWAQSVTSGRRN